MIAMIYLNFSALLDRPRVGAKARALVERHRARMVEGAGMDPEPADRLRDVVALGLVVGGVLCIAGGQLDGSVGLPGIGFAGYRSFAS